MKFCQIVLHIFIFCIPSYSQNLIKNHSFEESREENKYHLPNNFGQVDSLKNWETRTVKKNQNGNPVLLHSPDWYKTGTTFTPNGNFNHPTAKNTPIDFSVVPAQDGRCYVGMGPCELVQQNLSITPVKNKEYTVRIYIRPVKEMGVNWNVNTHLNIYLSKKRFKYTNNAANDFCQDNFCAKLGDNNSQLILSRNISVSQYPFGSWYLLEQTFVVNDNEYDWIIIESQESISPGNCRTYLLIDNVSLQRSCELSCDQSSGAINSPSFINNPGQWWGISNIDNVTEAIIDIYTIVGQSFVRRIYKKATNGIKHPIYWDGKDENNNSVATAAYIAQITLKNDCDEKNFGQVISHQNINHNLSPLLIILTTPAR